jgi:7-cyano-7-deazaguanine reductase
MSEQPEEPLHDKGPLLGRQVAGSAAYDPSLLFPVPRSNARSQLRTGAFEAFGEDLWHAYELSWLGQGGMPQMFLGRLSVPVTSPNLIESKSLKLYLNSLNSHKFADVETARRTIEEDLSAVAGASVAVTLSAVEGPQFNPCPLPGSCLDGLQVVPTGSPDVAMLEQQSGDAALYTHLMRSLCPVTAQPDWATVIVETRGNSPQPASLLAYLLAYRNHQEFHEQCVERIFDDLWVALEPSYLSVYALYTRRGGLDICPWRCSEDLPAPATRINRQ